jgi:hypothetical protein
MAETYNIMKIKIKKENLYMTKGVKQETIHSIGKMVTKKKKTMWIM